VSALLAFVTPRRIKASHRRRRRIASGHFVQHDYDVLLRATAGQQLDVVEEDQIRLHGGLKGRRDDGGGVVNRRYQMNDNRYRKAGGTIRLPASTRIRGRR
jgi:hypothetical protein